MLPTRGFAGSQACPLEQEMMFSGVEMSTVLDSLPIALVTTDSSGRIVTANTAALTLFGYEEDELLGQAVEILIPRKAAKNHQKLYQGFVRSPSTRPMGEGRDLLALKSNGEEFPVEIALTVMPADPPFFLASVIDISLRKKNEKLLKDQQQVLEKSLAEAMGKLEKEIQEAASLKERQRLGRELHDSLSQNLYGIGLGLRTSLAKVAKNADPKDALNYCLELTEASLIEMRAMLFRLRPQSLEDVPLSDVLKSHAQAVSARVKIPINFIQKGQPKVELPFEQKYALYRIATEALHNCIKHAEAQEIELTLTFGHRSIELEVRDNGRGFDRQKAAVGHGMSTMNERATAVDGKLELESTEQGTRVHATVPWSFAKR